jgi:predicted NBD/HSP70 family sugar kinase
MKTANTSRIIKKANQHLLFHTIKEYEPITIEEIIRKTRLSRPTVLTLLDELLNRKIVQKAGFGESMGGRQPVLYSLDASTYFAVGIDFEFPPVRIVFSDIKGNIVYSGKWEQEYGDKIQDITENILSEIEKGMRELGIRKENIIGAGVGISGTVDINENVPVSVARIPEWDRTPINNIIQERAGFPVYVRNDAHLVGMVEKSLSKNLDNFLYIAYRTGIGAGVFINGKLYDGEFGNPGYIGHTAVDPDGEKCLCGNYGCLELYCSKPAIEKRYKELTGKKARYADIIERSDAGDATAAEVLERAGRYFGTAIANMIKLFDISNVVIGDILCSEDNIFFKTIAGTIRKNVSAYALKEVIIRRGVTDEYAFALGGCFFALDNFFSEPKLRLTVT